MGAAGFTLVGRMLPPSPLGLGKINHMVSPMCPGKVMDYGGGRKTLELSWQVAKKNLEQIPHIMSETPSEAYIYCKEETILQGHLASTERGTSNPVVALLMAQGLCYHRARGVTNRQNDRPGNYA